MPVVTSDHTMSLCSPLTLRHRQRDKSSYKDKTHHHLDRFIVATNIFCCY